jgi:hypothetical protein
MASPRRSCHSPVIEKYDEALLPVLADSGGWLTTERIAARCEDPWAAGVAAEWLERAAERGLVHVRRTPRDGPLEWTLSRAGRAALRRSRRP